MRISNPAVMIESRERKIEKKRKSIEYFRSLMHTNPRHFERQIFIAETDIGQLQFEIDLIKEHVK